MRHGESRLNGGSRLGGVRVLVVDDAPLVRAVVTDILRQDGASVTAVGSAEEALAALEGERPDEKPIGFDELIGAVAILALKDHAT